MLKYLLPLALALSLQAQPPVRITDVNQKDLQIAAPGAKFESALLAIATTGTTVTTTTTAVQLIYCTNNTGSATTLSIQDGNAVSYMTTASLAANTVVLFNFSTLGITFTNGIVITAANAATVRCQVKGAQ